MQKTVEDVKKEFDDKLLIVGNKSYFLFVFANYIFFIINIISLYMYSRTKLYGSLKYMVLQTGLIFIAFFHNLLTKWKTKVFKYVIAIVVIIFECIMLIKYQDSDCILILICSIPVTAIYLDAFFTTFIGIITFIAFWVSLIYNMYSIEGRTLAYSIWIYYSPLLLTAIFTSFFSVFCKKVKATMLKEKIDGFEIEKAKKDNALANRIQEGFLNDDFPSNDVYDISACMIPSRDVGGDFYDFYMIDETRLAMIVADVSGKGIPAALLMVNAKTMIRDYVCCGVSFEKSMETANRDIMQENKELQLITFFMCIVDLTTGKMNYINAGHVKPFVMNKNGEVSIITSKPDFVFGVRKDTRYHSNEYTLNPGDKLLLCTDGVTERLDNTETLYGKGRLMEMLSKNSQKATIDIISQILISLNEFSKGREQNDDITCLLFNYKKNLLLEPPISKDFSVSKDNVDSIISYIKDALKIKDVPEKIINLISVASDEIISNVSKYAYEGMDKEKLLNVKIKIYDGVINVIYTDSGKYFNPLSKITLSGTTKVTDKSKIGGLGIQLTWNIMDDVSYKRENDKNVISIEKEY